MHEFVMSCLVCRTSANEMCVRINCLTFTPKISFCSYDFVLIGGRAMGWTTCGNCILRTTRPPLLIELSTGNVDCPGRERAVHDIFPLRLKLKRSITFSRLFDSISIEGGMALIIVGDETEPNSICCFQLDNFRINKAWKMRKANGWIKAQTENNLIKPTPLILRAHRRNDVLSHGNQISCRILFSRKISKYD